MPSGSATRPGDIVRSMSGQTVEIVNTDAEGRLVLGDCLWYIQEKFGVKKIIDVATLTGSTMMTFGFEYAGLFANDDKLAAELTACGETSGEKLWRLPINAEYDKLMDSDIADMKTQVPGWPAASPPPVSCNASSKKASNGRIWTLPASTKTTKAIR